MFQFLIGTVKTSLFVPEEHYFQEFQFLIGTVKTFFFSFFFVKYAEVSIPHRYCKNSFYQHQADQNSQFQFLIGTVKTNKESHLWLSVRRFQFLIGTVKTSMKECLKN